MPLSLSFPSERNCCLEGGGVAGGKTRRARVCAHSDRIHARMPIKRKTLLLLLLLWLAVARALLPPLAFPLFIAYSCLFLSGRPHVNTTFRAHRSTQSLSLFNPSASINIFFPLLSALHSYSIRLAYTIYCAGRSFALFLFSLSLFFFFFFVLLLLLRFYTYIYLLNASLLYTYIYPPASISSKTWFTKGLDKIGSTFAEGALFFCIFARLQIYNILICI